MRTGVHLVLEEEANRIIRESLRGVTSHEAKRDILTPWKQQDRWRREVYTESGAPDGRLMRGIFNRRSNPTHSYLNSRDGALRGRPDGLSRHVGQDD